MNNEICNKNLLHAICNHFQLGESTAELSVLSGGLLHESWLMKLKTEKFVIKVLNPSIINKPNIKERYRITEKISFALCEKVSLVTALVCNEDPLFSFDGKIIMVFPYVSGKLIEQTDITHYHIKQIGMAIANIHNAAIKIKNAPAVDILFFDPLEWETRYIRLQQTAPAVAKILDEVQPIIKDAFDQYKKHISTLTTNLVISHRDCDPKNVLWDKYEHYYLIDWEAAGLINKTKDVIATALYWSMDTVYNVNIENFLVFVRAYLDNAGIINVGEIEAGLYGLAADWISWLDFNLSRICDHQKDSDEYNLGIAESLKTLKAFPKLLNQFSMIKNAFVNEVNFL